MTRWCLLLVCSFASVCGAWSATTKDGAAHRVVMVQGASHKLECLDWPGTGEPIVLLAGLGSTAHIFEGIAPRLAEKHRVVALTRRGIGASESPQVDFDMSALLQDIRLAVDQFGFERVVLVAHSFGCTEASLFAQAYPARVSAVIYLDGPYRPSDGGSNCWRVWAP